MPSTPQAMTGNQDRQFRFGAVVHQDYQAWALLLPELEDRLNQQIDLREYTDQVRRIYFVPIIVPESINDQEEERRFDEADQQLWIRVKLDANALQHATETSFTQLLSRRLREELHAFQVLPPEVMEKIYEIIG